MKKLNDLSYKPASMLMPLAFITYHLILISVVDSTVFSFEALIVENGSFDCNPIALFV